MELNICHLYPDILNLYGDRGNVLCMRKRLKDRGISVNIKGISVGEKLNVHEFDLFFVGGGQDFDQGVLLEDLQGNKSRAIYQAIDDGKTFLAICGGYQLLGNYYKTHDDQKYDFIGAINVYTVGQKNRMIGNYCFASDDLDGEVIVGFENHSGKTYLGDGVRPMGKVLSGHGNNSEDGLEGARYKNVFATYSHGSLLPKNPKLCDLILKTALIHKYGRAELSSLNDELELKAHDYMVQRLMKMK